MSCAEWQVRIAGEDAAALEHAAACVECSAFARELAANRDALAGVALSEAAAAAVRARVLSDIRRGRRWRWAWAFVPAMAILTGVLLVPTSTTIERPPDLSARLAPPAPAPAMDQVRPKLSPTRYKIRKRSQRPVMARTAPVHEIKLLTDDPNVVIIWLTDEGGS